MSVSDAQITRYVVTTLHRAAARKTAQHRRRRNMELLLWDTPVNGDDPEDKRTWGEFFPAPEESVEETVIRNMVVRQALYSLPPKERAVLEELFVYQQNETSTARKLGLCQQRVSQLKRQALLRMKAQLERPGGLS